METPDLPVEIIIYILSFLQAADRKEASLVCRIWYIASQDYQFQKNLTFKVPASSSSLDVIRRLARHPRCGIVISHLDGSRVSREVLVEVGACLGPRLERLSLPGSSVTESSLLCLLPHLTALRQLDLHGLDSLFMSGAFLSKDESRRQVRAALGRLEELDLSDLRYLSDLTFNRLTGCTPHLRRLSLAGCHIAFEFDPAGGDTAGAGPEQDQHHPESLCSLARVEGLRLEELRLRGCKELTDRAVEAVCKYQPALHTLDLSACTELTSRAALAVASGLRGLQHLYLSRAWRVTDGPLAKLAGLRDLQTLDLSECIHVSGVELVKGLSSPQAGVHLVSLNFRSCTYVKDLTVFSLAQLLGPSLRMLDLTSCLYLTDLSVRAITTYLPALVVLRLGCCREVTDWGLLGMVEPTKEFNLEKEEDKGPSFTRTFGNMGFFQPPRMLFDEKPRLVTEDDLETFRGQEGASLLALRGLQELDLSACCKLTDSSITQVLRFPDLQKLSLSMLPEISDDSLASVAWHCRNLASLSLSHCPRLSDRGMARAAPHLRRLQHLHLACCNHISDRSLAVLAQNCRSLRSLDVSMCKDITMAAVDLLQSQLPFLENVHCRFMGGANLTLAF
ncbi:hypothetical protein AAFF_G00227340 [Aldrovandia affinis]|uniref:F-box domain-containing protein n=1 Tax=Aldrovandia affinis TaxID=143900 RepID=A0AAD7TCZ1_9TELE|nr:hypothetical protein AAFF_G00227340 [Aldrovandia affinis]